MFLQKLGDAPQSLSRFLEGIYILAEGKAQEPLSDIAVFITVKFRDRDGGNTELLSKEPSHTGSKPQHLQFLRYVIRTESPFLVP